MTFLIGFAALWVLWLLLPQRLRKRTAWPAIGAVLVTCLLSPAGIALGSWLLTASVPADSGEAVDAIVVLGRGEGLRDRRIAVAQALWEAKRAPFIFASGMLDARTMVEALETMGVPERSLKGEECSQSTVENGQFTSALLYPNGIRTILLVTDSPHTLRSLLVFRRFGFSPIAHPAKLPELTTWQHAWILLREYAGLAVYAITGKFNPASAQDLQNPPTAITSKIASWSCYVAPT